MTKWRLVRKHTDAEAYYQASLACTCSEETREAARPEKMLDKRHDDDCGTPKKFKRLADLRVVEAVP